MVDNSERTASSISPVQSPERLFLLIKIVFSGFDLDLLLVLD